MAPFATSHGKTVADGMAGTLKLMAAKASLQRPNENQILNAMNLHQTNFCYVTNEEYNEEENFLQARFLKLKTEPGTQK